jgi:hypothetical protein
VSNQSLITAPHHPSRLQAANAKKAISPTQFNHQSTRGHCIMTLECNMPVRCKEKAIVAALTDGPRACLHKH